MLNLSDVHCYIGADIVAKVVKDNRAKFSSSLVSFEQLDLVEDPLPAVDLVFCRDCLVHLTLEQAARALKNIIYSGAKWALLTHFPNVTKNNNIKDGTYAWRPLNLYLPPFNLPEPIQLVKESSFYGQRAEDKYMALWNVTNLPTSEK